MDARIVNKRERTTILTQISALLFFSYFIRGTGTAERRTGPISSELSSDTSNHPESFKPTFWLETDQAERRVDRNFPGISFNIAGLEPNFCSKLGYLKLVPSARSLATAAGGFNQICAAVVTEGSGSPVREGHRGTHV